MEWNTELRRAFALPLFMLQNHMQVILRQSGCSRSILDYCHFSDTSAVLYLLISLPMARRLFLSSFFTAFKTKEYLQGAHLLERRPSRGRRDRTFSVLTEQKRLNRWDMLHSTNACSHVKKKVRSSSQFCTVNFALDIEYQSCIIQ